MKQIKPIVLKDATKLTNAEMKSIRGGYEPEKEKEYPSACFVRCEIGANPILETTCAGTPMSYCDVISGANGLGLGVGCFFDYAIEHILNESSAKYCNDPIPSEK
ncbi:MAG: hypothetical protein IJY75_04570 [Bacteroidaceae bacterium]|nr:hypothetical protein [Bacteroidaceae bacterium]